MTSDVRPDGPPRPLLLLGTMQVGGAERNVMALLPHLLSLGVGVHVATLTTHRDSYLVDQLPGNVPRHDLGARRLLDPGALARLVRILRAQRIDVVHGEDHAGALLGAAASALTGTPLVVTRHVVEYATTSRRERAKDRVLDSLLRHRRARRVIAVSDHLRRHLVEQVGVPAGRVVTVHNGIDPDTFLLPGLSPAEARRQIGCPPRVPVITMVAVLRHGKGHEVLFRALPAVRQAVAGAHVLLAGGGEAETAIRARAGAVGGIDVLSERDDIPRILRASDVLVLPSWTEALPTVLMEAAAAGTPAVATDVGGAAEIVDDGVTGFLVPPGDPAALAGRLVDLLEDPAAAAEMGRRAQARARARFSLQAQAVATRNVYQAATGLPSGSGAGTGP